MQSSVCTRPWLEKVGDLVETLGEAEPLTLLLGAGASRSSGAPSTEAVEASLRNRYRGRVKSRKELYEKLANEPESEKQAALRPLFENLDPYIGYHGLAALGRSRPVYVVNLNWDDAVTMACERLGVRCERVEYDDGALTIKQKLEAFKRGGENGVFCLHLHNRMGGEHAIRFATYETLSFGDELKELLAAEFFSNHTVIVGASLTGEHDVTDLLHGLVAKPKDSVMAYRPFWIFSRQAERSVMPVDRLLQHLLFQMKSQLNFVGDPAVDFDRMMLELASGLAGLAFPNLPDARATVPVLNDLAIPSRDIIGPYLKGETRHALVIEGDARIGKTSAACVMQFLSQLCDDPEPEVRYADRPHACLRELRAFVTAPRRGGPPNRILVLENPFGTTGDYDENKQLVSLLRRFRESCARRGSTRERLIITTRSSCWRAAIAKHGAVLSELPSTSLQAAKWYTEDELAAFLEARVHGTTPQARREIATGELTTPVAIEDAIKRTRGNSRRPDVIAEKRAFLSVLDDDTAWCAVLSRLQELSPNASTEPPLCRELEHAADCYATIEHMVTCSTLDDCEYVTPAHSTDREAIDAFYAEHRERFEGRLQELRHVRGGTAAACQLWEAIRSARAGDLGPMWTLDDETRRDWMPAFLEETARAGQMDATVELLEKVDLKDHDFWSLRELVFEVVRLWPALHASEHTHRFLHAVLADPTLKGRYLVLEAMLYLQAATYPDAWDLTTHAEVWDNVAAARWRLFHETDRAATALEIALMLDALVWCPPRIPEAETGRWLLALKEAAAAYSPLAAAYLFSALYHPHGCSIFRTGDVPHPAQTFGQRDFTPAEAALAVQLIEWHFVHQSRARALRYRRDLEPAHAYLLHRGASHVPARTLPDELQARCRYLIEQLARFPAHAGWAIHLGMNIYATLGEFEADFLAPLVEQVGLADRGLVTAVMTYKTPSALRHALVNYFAEDENRNALLDAMGGAPVVAGVGVSTPRFNALRSPGDIHSELELRWTELERDELPVNDPPAFLAELQRSAHAALDRCKAAERVRLQRHVWTVVRRTRRGDYRMLDGLKGRDFDEVPAHERLRERISQAAWDLSTVR